MDLTTLQALALDQIYGHGKNNEITGKEIASRIGLYE